MIKEGSRGSMCFYYKGLLITGYALTPKRTKDKYIYQGEHMIKQSRGVPIMKQIESYTEFCNIIYQRKLNKQRISRQNHIYFISCLCALLRLKIIEDDDMNGYYCFPKKK